MENIKIEYINNLSIIFFNYCYYFMEEIILIQNNIEKVYFLNLFNDHFHDENYLKIGIYKIEQNKLLIDFDNQTQYIFDYINTKNNIKRYQQILVSNKSNDSLNIIHETWEDKIILNKELNTLKRLNNEDTGTYEFINNSIIIHWDNYPSETFNLDEETKKYIIQSNNNINTIFIKNESWEEQCNYDLNTYILTRKNNEEKGNIKFEDHYLLIQWEQWDDELFYFYNNIYQNNSFYISTINIYIHELQEYLIDKQFIYKKSYKHELLNAKLYQYEQKDIFISIFNLEHDKIYELVQIENIYYELSKLKNIFLEDEHYYIFFEKKIILDVNYIIIGEFEQYEYKIKIHFYNNIENNTFTLVLKNDDYYLEHDLNKFQIYNKHHICYLDNNNKYLISNNKKQLVFENNNEFQIYYQVSHYYFNQKDYLYLKNCKFDQSVYQFFNENYDNIIKNIENNNIIYNQYSFEEKYLFLNDFKYLQDEFNINIFEKYGFMFIEYIDLSNVIFNNYHIFNVKINIEFKKEIVSFLDKIKQIHQEELKIFIFNDFSDYEYINSLININTLKNIVLLIDYSKSKIMKINYIYELLNRLCYLKNITIIKKKKVYRKNKYNEQFY